MAPAAARSIDTRHRLLEAAGEVFAEEGFRKATIQRICTRARANIAAAHYHFGDKERLYAAVIEYSDRLATATVPAAVPADGTPPEERLRRHLHAFLARILDRGRPAWHGRLMSREMIEPTAALDRLVRSKIRANHEHLAAIVRELLGPAARDDVVRRCVLSIAGQCMFYRHSAPVLARLYPDLVPSEQIEQIADHVTRFSLAAIRGLRAETRKRERAR